MVVTALGLRRPRRRLCWWLLVGLWQVLRVPLQVSLVRVLPVMLRLIRWMGVLLCWPLTLRIRGRRRGSHWIPPLDRTEGAAMHGGRFARSWSPLDTPLVFVVPAVPH